MKTATKVFLMACIAIGTGVGIAFAVTIEHDGDVEVFHVGSVDSVLDIKTDGDGDISAIRFIRARQTNSPQPGGAIRVVGDTSTNNARLDLLVNTSVSISGASDPRARISLDSASEGIVSLATGEFTNSGVPLAEIVLDSDGSSGVSNITVSAETVLIESDGASIDVTEGGDVIITLGT